MAARVVLPLAQHLPVHGHLGTRHRAALGISEQTDAVTIVVSEETGTISVAHNGRMIRRLGRERLRNVLRTFYDRGALRSGIQRVAGQGVVPLPTIVELGNRKVCEPCVAY